MQLGNGLISWSYNGSQYGAPPVGSFLHSITIYLFVLFSFGSPGADTFLNLSIVAGKSLYGVNKYFELVIKIKNIPHTRKYIHMSLKNLIRYRDNLIFREKRL